MNNKLRNFIAEIEARSEKDELDEKLLEMLQQKQSELGEDPTEEEADDAICEVIKEHFMLALRQKFMDDKHSNDDDEEDDTSEEECEAVKTIREVFKDMGLRFRDYRHQKGVHAFELGVREDGKLLRMRVYVEENVNVCRIDALFPFTADRSVAYPLCEKLAEENAPRRFGALQYDARDGELSYRYSFPIGHGLHKDDFRMVFLAVIKSAVDSYDIVKKYAGGRFRNNDRQEIMSRIQELLKELA